MLTTLLRTLLPPVCVICGDYTQTCYSICSYCQKKLPVLSPYHCIKCARFLMRSEPDSQNSQMICGHCLQDPPSFDQTYALFPYEWPISSFILKLKFQHQLYYAKILGELLAEKIKTSWYIDKSLPDCILPMPLHTNRLRERGFNQALEIAKPIAKQLNLSLDRHGIKRIKSTQAQSGLPAVDRSLNMNNAFAAYRHYKGMSIAILDDVITTGRSVRELSRILKDQGATTIVIWCCARRLIPHSF